MEHIPYPASYFDPYGDERRCRICDHVMEYNPLTREWECVQDHDEQDTLRIIPPIGS